ncbi:MAG: class I SAM-dependent methyltransferase [Sphingobacteriia bacterium]|jgi:ubiquinone/menaquinone biosynthesis C-methylase UbiE
MIKNIYNKEPLYIENDVAVFSDNDNYIENYEKISQDHLTHLAEQGENPFMSEEYWQSLEAVTLKQIVTILKPGDKILDVGVGLGRLLSQIELSVDKFGVDISKSYLSEAKAKGINVCLSKIEELPYHDNLFDVIVTTDVLEHVFDLNQCVKEIKRVLKPNGYLIVRVPYREDLSAYINYDQYEFIHLRNFDENYLDLFFRKIFNFKFINYELAGIIEDNTRLHIPFQSSKYKVNFFENLIQHYKLNKYYNKTRKDFCIAMLSEYNRFNFSFQKLFFVNQFFKIVYHFLNLVTSKEVYERTQLFRHIEISAIFKKQ